MKLTMVEELVIRRKRKYAHYWGEASNWYRLRRLFEEFIELTLCLVGLHEGPVRHELEQIASEAMNWMEQDNLP